MTRIVIGLFDSRGDADRAIAQLRRQVGLAPEAVEVHAAKDPGAGARAPGTAALDRLALPRDDMALFREAVRRNGIVVCAWVEERAVEPAMDAFEANNAVDLETREAEWRSGGWTGYTAHDEDIGFATYGQDAVIARIPKEHHEEGPPSGALGRMEAATGEGDARARRDRIRPRVRSFIRAAG